MVVHKKYNEFVKSQVIILTQKALLNLFVS